MKTVVQVLFIVLVSSVSGPVGASSAPRTAESVSLLKEDLSYAVTSMTAQLLANVGLPVINSFIPTSSMTIDTDQCGSEAADAVGADIGAYCGTSLLDFVEKAAAVKEPDAIGTAFAGMVTDWTNAMTPLKSMSGGSGGLGMGFGVTVLCSATSDIVYSFGAGGGGGGQHSGSFSAGCGGGGGGQTENYDFGGGAGCDVEAETCQHSVDGGSVSNIADLITHVQGRLEACKGSDLTVCIQGGGGLGISSTGASQCQWGAGFSISYSTSTGTSPAASCASAMGGAGAGVSARVCSVKCAVGSQSYNSCFCPCFKQSIIQAGLNFGHSIMCVGGGDDLISRNSTAKA